MPKIFISYRRADSRKDAGRIYDRLVEAFGKTNIFKDVDNIPVGDDFRGVLSEAVNKCEVVLAIIGKEWLNIKDADGKRRLDYVGDFVRIEIQTGLQRGGRCLVVPVLVDGAGMPSADDLPSDLRELAFKNASRVRDDPDFHNDVARLISELQKRYGASSTAASPMLPPVYNVQTSIARFYTLFDERNWDEARQLLAEIRASGKAPRVFNIDSHEKEIWAAIEAEERDREYEVLRMMVARPNPVGIWEALQKFWVSFPNFDPDNLARFQPLSPFTSKGAKYANPPRVYDNDDTVEDDAQQNSLESPFGHLGIVGRFSTGVSSGSMRYVGVSYDQFDDDEYSDDDDDYYDDIEGDENQSDNSTSVSTSLFRGTKSNNLATSNPFSATTRLSANSRLSSSFSNNSPLDAPRPSSSSFGSLRSSSPFGTPRGIFGAPRSSSSPFTSSPTSEKPLSFITAHKETIFALARLLFPFVVIVGLLILLFVIYLVVKPNTILSNKDWMPIEKTIDGVNVVQAPVGCFSLGNDPSAYDYQKKGVANGGQICFEKSFWIDKTEVTNNQFIKLNGKSVQPSKWMDGELPRETITWFEARDFCELRGGRLPTEAEWEYAARGPDNLFYPWGADFIADAVVYSGNSNNHTSPVGSKSLGVSWVGAVDMSGNVWEWTSTLYQPYPYPIPNSDEELNKWINSNDISNNRVVRGGSWDFYGFGNLRASSRNMNSPNYSDDIIGFRCLFSDPIP